MNFKDFASPEFFENPYPLYERVRRAGAILPIGPNAVVTGRLSVIEALLRDRGMGKTYMQSVIARYGDNAPSQPVFKALSRTLLMLNPPTHTSLRGNLMKAFNARQVDKLREIVETTANGLARRLAAKAEFDLMGEYALPLPVEIICRLLDIPSEHGNGLGADASRLVAAFDVAPLNDAMLAEANEAALTLEAYFRDVVAQRRANPGDDIISSLLAVEEGGVPLTEDEIISNVILLFVAGHETTSNMIGNALIALHRHPAELAELKREPALMSKAVVECMRYDGSVQMVVRTALEEVVADDVTLAPGTIVFMLIGAANRDPDSFPEPDRIDFGRAGNSRFLAFGAGIHYCLGARIALLEIEVALKTLISYFPDLQLVELDRLNWHKRNNLRGVQSLLARQQA
jgi:cytochrome P450